jgi:polysaccharide export outer membrane protein
MQSTKKPLRRALGQSLVLLPLCAGLVACDLLPSDGPNANGMTARASASLKGQSEDTITRYVLISINSNTAQRAAEYYQQHRPPAIDSPWSTGAFGRVGVGDLLHVTIWEAGEVGLFSGRERRGTEVAVRVDTDGTIAVPYAGRFPVAGMSLAQVEARIVGGLAGQASQPQVTVVIAENVSSSVSVQGDVNKPGTYPVVKANQRLLDMVAIAGGARYPAYETTVRHTHGTAKINATLEEVIEQPDTLNLPVSAGDTILLSRKQQKFLAFGAVAQPGEQMFKKVSLTLADALGQAWGLDSSRADAMGVYLFRREPAELVRQEGLALPENEHEAIPVVYQLDLKNPRSFFAMNIFPVEPDDIIYVSTAPLAEVSRFFQILSGAANTVFIPRVLRGGGITGN